MSTNINSTEQIVEINAGDQITNVNIVSQSTTQVISGEQVVTIDTNAGTIPAAWGSITGTLSNQTDLQNALNLKQNNITLTTTGTTGVASLVGSTLNIPNYVSSTKQTQWDSAYNDKINSAEVSGTTTKTLTLTQQDGGIIQASWSDFDTAPVTSVFGRTGDVVATEGDYNINQLSDVTITSATNGQVLKYNGTAWVNAADASGLTQVGLTVPTGLSVSGSPLTSNGTINVGLQTGYSIPTTAKQAEWDQAYNDKINSASVTGNSTKTLTLTQQDGGTVTASWTDQGLTSVGLAMPSAFTVSGSPLTSNGTITVTGSGTTSQYVRGDGSLATFPTTSNEAKTLIREVYNSTGATLTKGTVIYINGGQGNLPTVTKAIATGDPTSAQTFGIVQSDITNMNNGFVVIAGGIDNLDTQAYTEGTAIYLSPTTAGAWTSTKPYAPDHMVYLGVVVRSHPTQGVIEVKIQNGVEISEIHDVSARYPNNKDGLFYNSTTNVWENKSIAGVLGYTPVPQSRIITINGTAQDLSADRTYNVGTVTSVAASGGTGISISGSPVTGSGTISIVNTAPDQTVTITPSGLATVSGTYPNFTVGVSTAYSGSVTSVNASVPTGFEVSGVPITTAGTIDIKFASGYSLPTTAKQTQWDDAYTKRINSLTVTGNSGSSTLVSNVLNVPTYTLSGLGGEPAINAGTSLQYWRGDKTFQTLNTGVVPESGNVYFTEPRVRATVLSGLNITGGSISASDSVLDAFGKVQNQINGLIGGSIFQSTWNASTNNPTLTSSVGTKGYYYIVSVAGTTNLNGITDWQIGDWAIFDGTVWRKVDNTDAVVSVNGFTGTVSLGISNLADVSASSPTDTQLLRFNGTTSKWYNWTPTYISGNQTITLSGDVTGSGTTAITTSIGALKVTNAMLAGSINYAKMDAATVPTWNQDTTGNAATADKWKTARTLTIGATGKSVDGSANISWSASEIGLTSYLPLAGGTMTGQIVLAAGTTSTDYTKGVRFPNDPYGGSGDTSGLRLYADTTTGVEAQILELYVTNDNTGASQDKINFAAPNNNFVTINGNIIYNSANSNTITSLGTITTGVWNGTAIADSYISSASTWNAKIGGSGSAGYISKFDTGSTINSSGIYQNGSQIVIGGTTPKSATARLDVQNNTAIEGISIQMLAADAYSPLVVKDNAGTYMFQVKQTGEIGIGNPTLDGSTKLQVNGGIKLTGALSGTSATFNSTTAYGLEVYRTNSTDSRITITNTTTGTGIDKGLMLGEIGTTSYVYNYQNGSLILGTNGTDRLTISSTGAATFSSSVTAGTETNITGTSVNSRLLVTAAGVANTVLGFNNSGATTTGVTNNTSYVGVLQAYPLVFITDSTERLRISSTGAATFSDNLTAGKIIKSTNAGAGFRHFYNNGTGNIEMSQRSDGKLQIYAYNGTAYSDILLGIDGATGGGNVGIGSFSPSNKLEVVISSGPYNTLFHNSSTSTSDYNAIRITQGASGSATGYFGTGGSAAGNASFQNTFVIGTQTNHAFVLNTNDNERMRITSGGLVGIGTTTPSTLLTVNGTTRTTSADIGTTAGDIFISNLNRLSLTSVPTIEGQSSTKPLLIGTVDVQSLILYTNATERMRITSGGEVLINTTSGVGSSARLSISNGTAQEGLAIKLANTSAYSPIAVRDSSNNYMFQVNQNSYCAIGGGTTGTYKLEVTGDVRATTGFYDTSDIRFKNVINKIDSDNISAIEFTWKDNRTDKKHWGYSAQDVKKILPDAVKGTEETEYTVSYNEVHTWKIAHLESKIKELEAKLN